MERAEVVGGGRGGDAGEDAGLRLDERDREALLVEHGGGLEPDVAAADDERALGALDRRAERIGVVEGAHQENAGESAAGRLRQPPWPRAGGERQEIPAEPPAVGERYRPRRPVDGDGLDARDQLDPLGLVEALRAEEEPLAGELALEVALGKRRALVGGRGLVADEGQRAGVAEGAQLRDERGAGLARAYHHDACRCRVHASALRSFLRLRSLYMSAARSRNRRRSCR